MPSHSLSVRSTARRLLSQAALSALALLPLVGFMLGRADAQTLQFTRAQTTVAGNGTAGYTGDGGQATAATLNGPQGAVFDAAGNLFIADTKNNVVRRVDAVTGVITTVAGSGVAGTGCTDGTSALLCPIGQPYAVAIDASGSLYVSDPNNNLIRKVDSAGNIAKFAGTGTQGKTGNGGLALAATLYFPTDLQIDATGSYLYFADSKNGEVRRVNFATNILTLVAGTGIAGFTSDGILATASELNTTYGLALDTAGNVYIADTKNYRIRRVDAVTGIITTVAGSGVVGTSPGTTLPAPNNGNGGPATAAQLVFAQRLTVDAGGNLLITDSNDYQIRRVDAATGILSLYAGVGIAGTYVASSPASSGYAKTPLGIFQDAAGSVYYAEVGNNVIRKLATNASFPATAVGVSSAPQPLYVSLNAADTPTSVGVAAGFQDFTVGAVTGCTVGSSNVAGSVCAAPVSFTPQVPGLRTAPFVATDASGQIIEGISGIGKGALASVTPGTIATVAGGATAGSTGDGATATSALLSSPQGTAIDSAGNIFLADTANNKVREIVAATGKIITLAGTGVSGSTGDGGLATAAQLAASASVAVDVAGNVFIADTGNSKVRMISAQTGILSTVAGTGTSGFSGDGAAATAATLATPSGVAVDAAGNLCIADTGNNRVRKLNTQSGVITTVAGIGTAGYSGDGAAATASQLRGPAGVWVDSSGILYIADTQNHTVRAVDATKGFITTVAGTGVAGYSGDGSAATAAQLNLPTGIATDAAGNVYVAEKGNHVIRLISAGVITTVAGTGTSGFSGDAGSAVTAAVAAPTGVALDGLGRIYIADTANNRLRKVDVTAGSLAFATQIVQTTSTKRSASVLNAGNTALTLTDITITGPFATAATSTCAASSSATPPVATTLAPGARCSLDLTFTPTLAGPATGLITFTNSGAGVAKTLTLTGIGQPAQTNGPQTVTFAALADVAYGVAPLTLSASASSGLAISYTVSGPATLSGSTLTITGVGTVSVTASQAGNANYAAATPVTRTFRVTPGTLTIKATNQTIAYGAAIPTLTYTASGLAGTDTLATALSGTPSITTTATSTSVPGTYTITAAAGTATATNYTLAFTNGTLTITKLSSATALVLPPATVYSTQSFSLSTTVAGAGSVQPTGTVTFTAGTSTLGVVTLSAGTGTATIAALPAGTYGVIASYSGDGIYQPSVSLSTAIVSTTPPDYSLTFLPTSVTIPRGQTGLITLQVVPVSSYVGTVQVSCGALPANVQCSFSPALMLLDGTNKPLQSQLLISTTGASTGSLVPILSKRGCGEIALLLLSLASIACLSLRGKRSPGALLMAIFLLGCGALAGCGVRGELATTSTFNVTINAIDSAAKVTRTATVSVTVQ